MRPRWKTYALLGVCLYVGAHAKAWAPKIMAYGPSTSLPKGWYIRAVPARELRVGDLAVFSTPKSMGPYMPTELPHTRILKQVAGVEGHGVCWDEEAMAVTGELDPATGFPTWTARYPYHPEAPIRHEERCVVLGEDDVVLTGTNSKSFDSRYIGPVSKRLMQWRAWPLWTWSGE